MQGFRHTKYIFITGGVISSLGKGIAASSIGALMESRGLRISLLKMDPYINVDPGTMSPFQHGEVFVTDDGAETDLDLGHYERFTTVSMGRHNNFTTGQVYDRVITKERAGEYLGRTVQVIPHVTDEIKRMIRRVGEEEGSAVDLVIVEVGGTVGDIESLPFLEAIRQLRLELGHQNSLSIHVTLVPYMRAADELKTKPTQHSVQKLREIGIQPEVILCRTDRPLPQSLKDKICLFCNVEPGAVIEMRDVESTIYEVPLALQRERLDDLIAHRLNIWSRSAELRDWQRIVELGRHPAGEVEVAIVGKYVDLKESYKSLNEALVHGGFANEVRVNLTFVDSATLESSACCAPLAQVDAILVPGGFGERGVEGKIQAIRFAREQAIPFFGICLGMQLLVIEHARHLLGLEGANSSEFDPHTPHPVVDLLPEQRAVTAKGATMRRGAYPCRLLPGSQAARLYGQEEIAERHRHRFEVNPEYVDQLEASGLVLSGRSPDGRLVELVERPDHPWFLGCQFHPEFKSRPTRPHPLFTGFIGAAARRRQGRSC